MRPSRGMGDIAPSKMPGGKKKARRDNTDFTQFKEGGMAGGKWIKDAIKKPGSLREALGAKKGEPIPAKKLAQS